jgi:hypothetical protein
MQVPRALAIALVTSATCLAQTSGAPGYDPRLTFAPLALPDPVNAYRSGGGSPGPAYWQNQADYEMHATLDTAAKQIANSEIITYTNNSPDTLTSLWLHLEQDTYKKDSRSARLSGGGGRSGRGGDAQVRNTDGFVFESVEIERDKKTVKADTLVDDARMQIRLGEPLKSHGQLKIRIRYHYQVPGTWGGRTSWGASPKGEIYDIAQWYPRMAVYDDLRGWVRSPTSDRSSIWSTGTSITSLQSRPR